MSGIKKVRRIPPVGLRSVREERRGLSRRPSLSLLVNDDGNTREIVGLFPPLKMHVVDSKVVSGFVLKFKVSIFSLCLLGSKLLLGESSAPPAGSLSFFLERRKHLQGTIDRAMETLSFLSGLLRPAKMHLSLARWGAGKVDREVERPAALPERSGFQTG